MRLLLLLLVLTTASGCEYEGKTYNDGDIWNVRGTFMVKCSHFRNGGWKVDILACIAQNNTEIPLNSSKIIGDDEWSCTANDKGLVVLKRVNVNRKCGNHSVGDTWQYGHFELICGPDGDTELINCVTETGEKIPVNTEKTIGDYLIKCHYYPNGTAGMMKIPINVEVKCVDSKGVKHNVGSFWLENERFNKTCTASGRIIVQNCVTNEGIIVPIDGDVIRNGTKYTCEKTVDGVIHFTAEFISNEASAQE